VGVGNGRFTQLVIVCRAGERSAGSARWRQRPASQAELVACSQYAVVLARCLADRGTPARELCVEAQLGVDANAASQSLSAVGLVVQARLEGEATLTTGELASLAAAAVERSPGWAHLALEQVAIAAHLTPIDPAPGFGAASHLSPISRRAILLSGIGAVVMAVAPGERRKSRQRAT
jgi:hypothetical protein